MMDALLATGLTCKNHLHPITAEAQRTQRKTGSPENALTTESLHNGPVSVWKAIRFWIQNHPSHP
jgi:hypothetical protein